MKYLGIDYGTKRIGLAISDENGMLAFPYNIIASDKHVTDTICSLIEQENIEQIVVGRSVQLDGTENELEKDIHRFVETLGSVCHIPIVRENEWLSSVSARSHHYGKGNVANPKWTGKTNAQKRSAIDDSAAAIILQRYLDRQGK